MCRRGLWLEKGDVARKRWSGLRPGRRRARRRRPADSRSRRPSTPAPARRRRRSCGATRPRAPLIPVVSGPHSFPPRPRGRGRRPRRSTRCWRSSRAHHQCSSAALHLGRLVRRQRLARRGGAHPDGHARPLGRGCASSADGRCERRSRAAPARRNAAAGGASRPARRPRPCAGAPSRTGGRGTTRRAAAPSDEEPARRRVSFESPSGARSLRPRRLLRGGGGEEAPPRGSKKPKPRRRRPARRTLLRREAVEDPRARCRREQQPAAPRRP